MTTSFEMPTTARQQPGRVIHTDVVRPFHVRRMGADRSGATHFGSFEAARRAARSGDIIFIDYAPGCGYFIEEVGR